MAVYKEIPYIRTQSDETPFPLSTHSQNEDAVQIHPGIQMFRICPEVVRLTDATSY